MSDQLARFSVGQAKRIGTAVVDFEARGRNRLQPRREYPVINNGTNSTPITTVTTNAVTSLTQLANKMLEVDSANLTVFSVNSTTSTTIDLLTSLGGGNVGGMGSGNVSIVYDSTAATSTGDSIIFNGSYQGFGNSTWSINATQIHMGTVVDIWAAGVWTCPGGNSNQFITVDANLGSSCTMYFALQGTGASHQEFIYHLGITFDTQTSGSAFGCHTINAGPNFGFDPSLSNPGYPNSNTNIAAQRGFNFNTGTTNKWMLMLTGDAGTGTVTLTSLIVKLAT